MDHTIYNIIENEEITTLYQPIVNLITGEVMGFEALSRGPEWSTLFSPIALIEAAETNNLTDELEYLFRKKAIMNMKKLEPNQKLFININPDIMKKEHYQSGKTQKMLEASKIKTSNIVFELTERTIITDYDVFNDILNHYKHQHYKIAIDDVGAGYSGLRTIKETQPNYIKIDMELIRDIDKDSIKEALINAFLTFSITTNIQLIAEGIETESELLKLIEMGVHYGQGYFLQRPNAKIEKLRQEVVNLIVNQNVNKYDSNIFNDSKNMIGSITTDICSVKANINCSDIKKTINILNCEGLCIVENNKAIGIIMRDNLLSMLSSQYGLSLYGSKKISHIMDMDFLMVDYYTSISVVSKKAMARDQGKTYDIVVVTKDSEFYGTISINTLLKNLISVETQIAKELNPLTCLPGNTIINRVLNDLLIYRPQCGIIYIDFDDFKPYNDYYGFESGDRVIKCFANILQSEIKNKLPYSSFVGHIGGDDFISVLEAPQETVHEICQTLINRFQACQSSFYSQEDYQNGYIISKTRNGRVKKFSLLTISISGIYNNLSRFDNVINLSMHMSSLKKESKIIIGNAIVIR